MTWHRYVLISGTAYTYQSEPRRRWGATMDGSKEAKLKRRTPGAEAFAGMKPTETLHAGQAIGEDELLQEDPVHMVTAITTEPVEVMEIDRRDFDRILKADRSSEKGRYGACPALLAPPRAAPLTTAPPCHGAGSSTFSTASVR